LPYYYYCYIAENEDGLVESKTGKITVRAEVEVEDKTIKVKQNKKEVLDGKVEKTSDVVLSVEKATGYQPKYQWQTSKTPLEEETWTNIKSATKNSYTIKKKLLEDGMSYRCVIYNGTGLDTEEFIGTRIESNSITLEIIE
jgi:hypothetical protein